MRVAKLFSIVSIRAMCICGDLFRQLVVYKCSINRCHNRVPYPFIIKPWYGGQGYAVTRGHILVCLNVF